MRKIKIPDGHWGKVWRTLIQEGPITQVTKDHVYLVSEHHIHVLNEKQLPYFEVDSNVNSSEKIRHLLACDVSLNLLIS